MKRRDPEVLIGFYAEDAELRVVNADIPDGPAFKLCGRAEIEKCLRVIFGQKISSRIEDEAVSEQRVSFSEICEYPEGSRVLVRTTLELHGHEIGRQLDVVSVKSTQNQERRHG